MGVTSGGIGRNRLPVAQYKPGVSRSGCRTTVGSLHNGPTVVRRRDGGGRTIGFYHLGPLASPFWPARSHRVHHPAGVLGPGATFTGTGCRFFGPVSLGECNTLPQAERHERYSAARFPEHCHGHSPFLVCLFMDAAQEERNASSPIGFRNACPSAMHIQSNPYARLSRSPGRKGGRAAIRLYRGWFFRSRPMEDLKNVAAGMPFLRTCCRLPTTTRWARDVPQSLSVPEQALNSGACGTVMRYPAGCLPDQTAVCREPASVAPWSWYQHRNSRCLVGGGWVRRGVRGSRQSVGDARRIPPTLPLLPGEKATGLAGPNTQGLPLPGKAPIWKLTDE